MASPFRAGCQNTARVLRSSRFQSIRQFSLTVSRRTDGVFRELTSVRVAVPWIQALRQKEAQDAAGVAKLTGKAELSTGRKLDPKRMKDSYHSVVRDH
jgi:acyl-coenzyme A thioesterase 9